MNDYINASFVQIFIFAGENKSLEIVSDCFTDITIRTSKCSQSYRLISVLDTKKKNGFL